MQIEAIINIGADGLSKDAARNVRLVNLLTIITSAGTLLYLFFFLLAEATLPMALNVVMIPLYLIAFLLVSRGKHRHAKIWLVSIFMLHMLIQTAFVCSKAAGFHYFYLVTPPIVFLLFEHGARKEKILLSVTAVLLFYWCEFLGLQQPLVELSLQAARFFHLFSILTIFIGILAVIILFIHDLGRHEEQQAALIADLEAALSEVRTLQGFLPICASCKSIRDDSGYWNKIENYILEHSQAVLSHSLCPQCTEKLYGNETWYRPKTFENK